MALLSFQHVLRSRYYTARPNPCDVFCLGIYALICAAAYTDEQAILYFCVLGRCAWVCVHGRFTIGLSIIVNETDMPVPETIVSNAWFGRYAFWRAMTFVS